MWWLVLACREPVDTGEPVDTADTDFVPASAAWCDRFAPAPADPRPPVVALSEAHAAVRLFGQDPRMSVPDAALAAALAGEIDAPDLDAYVAGLAEACVVPDAGAALGPFEVTLHGEVAWVRPGLGVPTLPAGARAVVVDLRDLPADPAVGDAAAAAAALALAGEVPLAEQSVRVFEGYVDQAYSASNVYKLDRDVEAPTLAGAAPAALPLAFVVGDRVAPAAARVAAGLRARGLAWWVGQDLPVTVAEASSATVGSRGLAWRDRRLLVDGAPLPDLLVADVATATPVRDTADLAAWGAPPAWGGEAARAGVSARPKPWDERADYGAATSVGELRAGLVVYHGVLRSFYPYFDVVGDDLDARLVEALGADLDPADLTGHAWAFGRMTEVIHDGHSFLGHPGLTAAGVVSVSFDFGDDRRPWIRTSSDPGLRPGDALLTIDGVDAIDVLEAELTVTGAATEGYARVRASYDLARLDAPETWSVEAPDGSRRDVTVTPAGAIAQPWGPSLRPSGRLDDLDAPDVLYLNAGDDLDEAIATQRALIDAAKVDATGVILDLRGYPTGSARDLMRELIPGAYEGPLYGVPRRTPDGLTYEDDIYDYTGVGDAWTGPLVVLVGPRSASYAEDCASTIVNADRATFVGRQTAGTNGNITGIVAPGPVYAMFTGMRVQYADGATFHGVGVVPDVVVGPTRADLAAGRDAELEAAIEEL